MLCGIVISFVVLLYVHWNWNKPQSLDNLADNVVHKTKRKLYLVVDMLWFIFFPWFRFFQNHLISFKLVIFFRPVIKSKKIWKFLPHIPKNSSTLHQFLQPTYTFFPQFLPYISRSHIILFFFFFLNIFFTKNLTTDFWTCLDRWSHFFSTWQSKQPLPACQFF